MIYEKCRDILLRECELVQEAAVLQEKLRLSVINREWGGFEGSIETLNVIENRLAGLENEREKLFEEFTRQNAPLYTDAKGRFYAMISHLPENQRGDLTAIYRSLKMESLKLRIANEALMSYLAEIRAAFSDFFAVTFPDRAGKTYTKDGIHFSHDMRSILLDRSF